MSVFVGTLSALSFRFAQIISYAFSCCWVDFFYHRRFAAFTQLSFNVTRRNFFSTSLFYRKTNDFIRSFRSSCPKRINTCTHCVNRMRAQKSDARKKCENEVICLWIIYKKIDVDFGETLRKCTLHTCTIWKRANIQLHLKSVCKEKSHL